MSEQQNETLRTHLTTMADRIAATGPTHPMTEGDRRDIAHDITGGKEPMYSAVLDRSAPMCPGATRGDYARILRGEADTA
jgi:hypothetical protein